jgi:D-inositol-3-phosphate glycosyltransferase
MSRRAITPGLPSPPGAARRLAVLSVHTCPLAALGGKETGGMNVYVREVARELGRLGFQLDVFTRSQDASVPAVVPLGPGARVIHVQAGPQRPLPRRELLAHLRTFAAGVAAFRRETGGEYALVHAHYWLSGLVALDLAARWGIPLVQMFHTLGHRKNAVAREAGERELPERLEAEARIARLADHLVAATPAERAELAWSGGADPDRVSVIPCGVDVELFRPGEMAAARARLGLDGGRVLLFVGRLTPIKGLETLLRALARLDGREAGGPAPRLLVVGGDRDERLDGERGRLRRLATDLGLRGQVEFRGPQPQDVLPDYYRAADLCLIPSRHESFGMVALEAMACGVPVVASRVGGLAVTVRDGVTGVLVPEGDPVALGAAAAALLGDEPRRRALGRGATAWARRFAWPCVARAIAGLYADLLPALAPAPPEPAESCVDLRRELERAGSGL